jgi:hypothetical protein
MLRPFIASSILRNAAGENADGGGAASAGANTTTAGTPAGAGEAPLQLTQTQLDAIVQRAIAKNERKATRTVSEIQAERTRLETELAEARAALEGSADPTKNPELAKAQRELARLQAEKDALAKERAEAASKLDAMTTAQKQRAIGDTLRSELTRAGAHATGIDQAARLLAMDGTAEIDDDGTITVTLAGVPYSGPTLSKAVGAWLTQNPHFAKSPEGGSGASRPNGSRGPALDFEKATPEALISSGLSRPPGS